MRRIFLSTSVFLVAVSCYAQLNSHYWSHQYGARGLLLNGAVVASVQDETAIYYNPGALGISHDFGVSVSLVTPSYSFVKVSDYLGEGSDFSNRDLGLAPGLVAAMIQPFKSDRFTLGFTSFTRFRSSLSGEDRVVMPIGEDLSEVFLGDVDFRRRLNERWLGIGMSFKVSDRLSFGATQFAAFRTEQINLRFRKQIFDRLDPSILRVGWLSDLEYRYRTTGGLLTKFGVVWYPGDFKIGATVTTNTLHIIDTGASYELDDQRKFLDGASSALSNDRSVTLQDYKTPWSIGFGVEIPIDGTLFAFSAEYFTHVPRYQVINDVDDPFDGTSPGSEPIVFTVSQGNEEVFNLGFGIERAVSDTYTWFYGFRTDFSPQFVSDVGENVSFLINSPDIYHISTGISYNYRKSRFSFGLDYAFGFKDGDQQLTDFSDISPDNIFTFNEEGDTYTQVHQLILFFTYDL